MKKFALLCSVAAIGYMSETCEVVLAKIKGSADPVRVNKDDFDADQDKPSGERQYSKYTGADEPEQSIIDARTTFDGLEGVRPQAAPSAPDFTSGTDAAPLPVDEEKQAIAPTSPTPNQRLVMKEGSKFFVVDGMGAKLESDGIDLAGYKSEKAARDAINALPH
jgi:hypothetical protein